MYKIVQNFSSFECLFAIHKLSMVQRTNFELTIIKATTLCCHQQRCFKRDWARLDYACTTLRSASEPAKGTTKGTTKLPEIMDYSLRSVLHRCGCRPKIKFQTYRPYSNSSLLPPCSEDAWKVAGPDSIAHVTHVILVLLASNVIYQLINQSINIRMISNNIAWLLYYNNNNIMHSLQFQLHIWTFPISSHPLGPRWLDKWGSTVACHNVATDLCIHLQRFYINNNNNNNCKWVKEIRYSKKK